MKRVHWIGGTSCGGIISVGLAAGKSHIRRMINYLLIQAFDYVTCAAFSWPIERRSSAATRKWCPNIARLESRPSSRLLSDRALCWGISKRTGWISLNFLVFYPGMFARPLEKNRDEMVHQVRDLLHHLYALFLRFLLQPFASPNPNNLNYYNFIPE